jgi:hypothetical protein
MCAKKRIFVYKLDSFVGFIVDEQVHAQECYEWLGLFPYNKGLQERAIRISSYSPSVKIPCFIHAKTPWWRAYLWSVKQVATSHLTTSANVTQTLLEGNHHHLQLSQSLRYLPAWCVLVGCVAHLISACQCKELACRNLLQYMWLWTHLPQILIVIFKLLNLYIQEKTSFTHVSNNYIPSKCYTKYHNILQKRVSKQTLLYNGQWVLSTLDSCPL